MACPPDTTDTKTLHDRVDRKGSDDLTPSVALTQVREAPDVAQPHAEAHAGQHVLGLVVPLGPVPGLRQLQLLQLLVAQDPGVQVGVGQLQLHGGGLRRAAGGSPGPVSGFMGER